MSDSEPREGVGNCEKRFAHRFGLGDVWRCGHVFGGLAGSWHVGRGSCNLMRDGTIVSTIVLRGGRGVESGVQGYLYQVSRRLNRSFSASFFREVGGFF